MRKAFGPLLVSLALTCAAAQEPTESQLLAALKYVPAEALLLDSSGVIEFADIRAGLGLRRLDVPGSWAEMLSDHPDLAVLASLPPSLPAALVNTLRVGGPDYGEVLGFELFDLSATLGFGQPPFNATLLFGDLDESSVVSAFGRRGYFVAQELFGGPLLCPEAGCDTGAAMDIRARDMANVFGGDLGRKFPVWLSDGVVIGSAAEQLVQFLAATAAGEHTSVADLGEVQAVNALLYEYPFVSSVWFVHPLALMNPDLLPLGAPEGAAEHARGVMQALNDNPLPPYALAAYAAVGDDSHEYGQVILVYQQEAAAREAAAALEQRLGLFESTRTKTTYLEALSNYGEVERPLVYEHEATGTWLVAVGVKAPIPFEPDDSGRPILSGSPYRMLLSMFMNRDTLWLVPSG